MALAFGLLAAPLLLLAAGETRRACKFFDAVPLRVRLGFVMHMSMECRADFGLALSA